MTVTVERIAPRRVKRRTLEAHEDLHMGLPVILFDAVEVEEDEEGNILSTHIPNQRGLQAAMAVERAWMDFKLCGEEIRFMRKALEMTGRELAEKLGVRPETVSRWESDKETIGWPHELLLRMRVVRALAPLAPALRHAAAEQLMDLKVNPARPGAGPILLAFSLVNVLLEKQPEPDPEPHWRSREKQQAA